MKLNDLSNFLNREDGQHITNVYLPSIKREVSLKPLSTGNVKTLSRIGIFNEFDLNNELLKLSLFDKMIIESVSSCGISSESITPIDFLSFLIGIRRLLDNTLTFSFKCTNCGNEFSHVIDLETEFLDFINNFQRKHLFFEKTDKNGNLWKFELESYTMKDYIYYRYYIEKIKNLKNNNLNIFHEINFIRYVLYIRNIWKNNEIIEDWKDQTLATKINFLNALPSEIILDVKSSEHSTICLLQYIRNNFDEEKILINIEKMEVICSSCGQKYKSLFSFDDFFYILGYAEDNQQIFMHILETETFLIYHKWFTLDQINSMSYLDFTLYGERIFAIYEEEEKQKAEEKQQNYDLMNANFEALGNLLVGE